MFLSACQTQGRTMQVTERLADPQAGKARMREIGSELATEFLELQKQGYPLPPSIALVGGAIAERKLLARGMSARFRREKGTKIKISILPMEPAVPRTKPFLIDVEYFIRNHQ
jgi:hypothetical protein